MTAFEGGSDKREKLQKAGTHIGAFLAGALAVHMAAQERTGQHDTGSVLNNPITESFDTYSYGDTYELFSSPNAERAIGALDRELNESGLKATPEQIAQVKSAVDAYVAANPRRMGETIDHGNGNVSSSSGYDPLYDLWGAATKTPDINPLVQGLLLKELSDRMAAQAKDVPSTPGGSFQQRFEPEDYGASDAVPHDPFEVDPQMRDIGPDKPKDI